MQIRACFANICYITTSILTVIISHNIDLEGGIILEVLLIAIQICQHFVTNAIRSRFDLASISVGERRRVVSQETRTVHQIHLIHRCVNVCKLILGEISVIERREQRIT